MDKGGNGEEKKENCKRKCGKLQMEGEKIHFSKRLKFVLSLPKWEISIGKKHFKNSGKMILYPLRKKFLFATVVCLGLASCFT